MGVFGPKYAPTFQAIINHAERFCGLLGRIEGGSPPRDPFVRGWVIGRCSEIETVLALMVRDWREERLDLEQATQAAAAYLDGLHDAAQNRFGIGLVLDCCAAEHAFTLPRTVDHDAVTRVLVPVSRPSSKDAVATWFDPSALLEFRGPPPRVAAERRPGSTQSRVVASARAVPTRRLKAGMPGEPVAGGAPRVAPKKEVP